MTRQIKGMFFQLIHDLLSEFNPEIAAEAGKNLSFDVNEIKASKWYPRDDLNTYIAKLSPQARMAIAKKTFPTIKKMTPLLNDAKSPVEVMKKSNDTTPLTEKGEPYTEWIFLEEKPDYIKVRIKNSFKELDITEGMILGIFDMFKIIRVNIKKELESEDSALFEIKWET